MPLIPPIKVTMLEERPPEVSQRAWRDLMREGHAVMGEMWHRDMLPDHFKPSAFQKYGYEPRTRSYKARKLAMVRRGKAQGGPDTPLVFTGQMRRMMQSLRTVRAFPSRVTIEMVGPRYMTFRPLDADAANRINAANPKAKQKRASRQPDKYKEVTAVTPAEAELLGRTLHEHVTRGLDALRAPKTTTP